jgi:hypothetical protein
LFARNLGRAANENGEDDLEGGSGVEEGEGEEESSDEEEAPKPEVIKPAAGRSARLAQKNASSQSLAAATAAATTSSSAAASQGKASDTPAERVWVQCNTCDKWRSLPSTVDPDKLPDIWTCDLNTFDDTLNNCDAPEESYKLPQEEQHEQLKAFVKVWAKKLKCADRAETRLSSAALTRGKKRKVDAEWIKCSSPSCGKWRAVPRTIETATLLKRLNKGRFYGGDGVWFCSMNSWDETTGSCAAPQEPLWNCRWNLNSNR